MQIYFLKKYSNKLNFYKVKFFNKLKLIKLSSKKQMIVKVKKQFYLPQCPAQSRPLVLLMCTIPQTYFQVLERFNIRNNS